MFHSSIATIVQNDEKKKRVACGKQKFYLRHYCVSVNTFLAHQVKFIWECFWSLENFRKVRERNHLLEDKNIDVAILVDMFGDILLFVSVAEYFHNRRTFYL